MEFFPTSRIFLTLGPLNITWYALCSLSGILLCYWLSLRTLKKMGYDEELIENYFYLMLPIAYIGARIWYVLFEWETYAKDPIRIFYIWEGGLAFHGGVIAAVILGYFYCKKYHINPRRLADAAMPNILIGQMIGRWGNFMNQEAFGAIVDGESLNWLPSFVKERMFIDGAYRQPTFLYEGIGNLIGWILIRFVFSKYGRKKRGDMAYAYFMWYGFVRLIVEGMRTDSLMIGPFRIAQIISIISIVIGLLGLLGVFDKLFKHTWMFKDEKPVILFDADGTLLDTTQLIVNSYRHVLDEHTLNEKNAVKYSDADLKKYMGPSLEVSLAELFPNGDIPQLVNEYRNYNRKYHDEMIRPIEGVEAMLKELKEKGYLLGVVSNKSESVVHHGLELCHIKDYFDTIICHEQVEKPKPDPQGLLAACKSLDRTHDDLIYVGDSDVDVATAKRISAFSVGVIFDEDRATQMKESKPCAMIRTWNELIHLVEEDREWSDNSTL